MAVQCLACGGINAGCVDADQHDAQRGKAFHCRRRKGGEGVVPPIHRHAFIGPHNDARRQGACHRMLKVLPQDERPLVDGVDHAARADERRKVQRADAMALRVIVQWCIGMRADVRRERQRADVDGTARRDACCPFLPVGRVAWKHGRASLHGWGDVADFLHGGACHPAQFATPAKTTVSVISNKPNKYLRPKKTGAEPDQKPYSSGCIPCRNLARAQASLPASNSRQGEGRHS